MKGFYGFDSQFLSMLDSVQQDLDLKITFRKKQSQEVKLQMTGR